MKKYLLLLVLFSSAIMAAHAQHKNVKDLDSLYNLLKKTHSFKDQIVGQKAVEYNAMYAGLRKDLDRDLPDHEVFLKLSALIFPITDNHIDFAQIVTVNFDAKKLKDSTFMKNYRLSDTYKHLPRFKGNLSALEKELAGKPADNVEGIYYNYDKELKVGIRRSGKGWLEGVVLSSAAAHWQPGEIAFFLHEREQNYYSIIMFGYLNKALYLSNSERFENSSLLKSGYRKNPGTRLFTNVVNRPVFQLKTINASTQYLKLGDFMASDENKAVAKAFYNSIKDSITAPNLIVDIRNNGGGYYSVSSQFLALLRRYADPGKIYALINFNTVSNAEQFAIKLKGIKNTILLGQTTMGRIAYGQNYGTQYVLPSNRFISTPTDLPAEKVDLEYEGKGVKPDIILDPTRDWMEQVLELIRKTPQ